jgi:hypothetical protein
LTTRPQTSNENKITQKKTLAHNKMETQRAYSPVGASNLPFHKQVMAGALAGTEVTQNQIPRQFN